MWQSLCSFFSVYDDFYFTSIHLQLIKVTIHLSLNDKNRKRYGTFNYSSLCIFLET